MKRSILPTIVIYIAKYVPSMRSPYFVIASEQVDGLKAIIKMMDDNRELRTLSWLTKCLFCFSLQPSHLSSYESTYSSTVSNPSGRRNRGQPVDTLSPLPG